MKSQKRNEIKEKQTELLAVSRGREEEKTCPPYPKGNNQK
jgi:hypothetical protein